MRYVVQEVVDALRHAEQKEKFYHNLFEVYFCYVSECLVGTLLTYASLHLLSKSGHGQLLYVTR